MKYMGSKSRIAKHIVPIIQDYIDKNNIETYIEPMVGGANIIDKIHCKTKIGYDINKYLIALLKRVQENEPLFESVSKDLYDKARTAVNNNDTSDFEDWEIGNIGFLASYNGRYFDGGYSKPGYEKTKNGLRYRDYYNESKNNLLNQAKNKEFKNIILYSEDYLKIPTYSNAVIYVDPPYENTKQYANSKNFDYKEFWNMIRKWSENNIVIVSEQHAPKDFKCIWRQEVSRSIKATDKSKAVEKLFVKEDRNAVSSNKSFNME